MTITSTTTSHLGTADMVNVDVLADGTAVLSVVNPALTHIGITVVAGSLDELHQVVVDIDHAITRARNEQAAQQRSTDR